MVITSLKSQKIVKKKNKKKTDFARQSLLMVTIALLNFIWLYLGTGRSCLRLGRDNGDQEICIDVRHSVFINM